MTAVWEKQSVCSSYPLLPQEIKNVFDHPLLRGKDTVKHLLSLCQGTRSVAELTMEFRTLATESGWNSEALHGTFKNYLHDSIKDELVSTDEPDDRVFPGTSVPIPPEPT